MIYWDNNATTPILPQVREAMLPFLSDNFANPSSPYTCARRVSSMMANSREAVAALVGADPDQITFTSGGTESIAMAWHLALFDHDAGSRSRVVTVATEHAAVLATANLWERHGKDVVVLPVERDGTLDLNRFKEACTEDTALVSVMFANNETGLIHPLETLTKIAHDQGALVHCDAVQAAGKIPVDVQALGIDLLSGSGHKFHAPKGIGLLVHREGLDTRTWMPGGDQEFGRRSGTENVPGIAGLGAAAREALSFLADPEGLKNMQAIVDQCVTDISTLLPDVEQACQDGPRLPNTRLLIFPDIESEALLALLDMEDICVSSGSACASGSQEPSHVLRAMGYPERKVRGAVRLSASRLSTLAEANRISECMGSIAHCLKP